MRETTLSRRQFLQAADEIRAIEEMLVSPCCWREQISLHDTVQAKSLRAEVRRLALAGKNRQEILAVIVDRYGSRILATPPAKGFSLLAYLVPAASSLVGFLAYAFFVYRTTSSGQVSTAETPRSEVHDRQIEKELKSYAAFD